MYYFTLFLFVLNIFSSNINACKCSCNCYKKKIYNNEDNKDKDKHKDNNLKENGRNCFYADGKNCGFITAILDLMVIFDYFPELFEEFKNTDNLVKNNNVADKFKINIINEIVNIRTKYLNNETGIDTHKLFELILKFIEELIHNFTYDYYIANQDFYRYNKFEMGIADNCKNYESILNGIFFIPPQRVEINSFEEIEKNKNTFKFDTIIYRYNNPFVHFIQFLNFNISNFYKVEYIFSNRICGNIKYKVISLYKFFNKKNKHLFEIPNGNNIQNFKNNKNIIIMDLNVKNSIDGGHLCNIIKKNNKFYHYSDNYYIECDENDVINNNFDKILEDYNKVGLHTFYKPSINSIIIICK